MARRPPLTTDSFLGHLFSPKKSALPTGLRKHPVVGGKGRKAARVNAYNRMPAFKQEVLRRSGQREAYLRGEATYRDARESFRPDAVVKKLAKPLRAKTRQTSRKAFRRRLDTLIADRIRLVALNQGKQFNLPRIIENVQMIPEEEYDDAVNITYPQLVLYGRDQDREVIMPDGSVRNPYWYH